MIALRRRPHSALAAFIDELWLYDGYISAHDHERILPSGTFELVLNLRENELRIHDSVKPGQCRRYSGAAVSGPHAGYFVSDAREEVSIMGVHFKAGGAYPLLGFPAGDVANAHVDLAEVWKSDAERLHTRLAELTDPTERFDLLENVLIRHLERPLAHHPAVALALHAHRSAAVCTRTRELARAAGLSERRFIDVFRDEVGMTPKMFDRVMRFQRVLPRISVDEPSDWAAIAATCGYYDQSHLIRDFREFAGISPTDYLQRMKVLRTGGAHVKPNHLAFAG